MADAGKFLLFFTSYKFPMDKGDISVEKFMLRKSTIH